jgi:hypothetical protein
MVISLILHERLNQYLRHQFNDENIKDKLLYIWLISEKHSQNCHFCKVKSITECDLSYKLICIWHLYSFLCMFFILYDCFEIKSINNLINGEYWKSEYTFNYFNMV